MRNRILSFLMVFCVMAITASAQQYGKIVDQFDEKETVNVLKPDLNKKVFIPFKSNEAMASKVTFISESFDTEIPDTWTINNTGTGTYPGWLWADVWAENGIPMVGHAVIDSDANGSGNTTAGELITPAFDASGAAGLKLEFDARYNDITADGGDLFTVDVYDGTDWVNVATWDEDHGTNDAVETVTIDITAYANAACQVRFVYADGGWDWFAAVDNVVIFEPDPTNLRAIDLVGNPFVTSGQEATFHVIYENIGSEVILGADYSVEVKDTLGNVLGTVAGVDIDPATIDTLAVTFTAGPADTIAIYGYVNFAGDADDSDNETSEMGFIILVEGTYVAQVGMDETFPPNRIPYDFFYKNSASQTIYTPDQLGIGGGLIQMIAYKNSFTTDLSEGKPVKVWIGETTETDMTNGWVDPSTLTLVYDDTLMLPAGVNTIPIMLETPYVYTGGNLVIYTYRVWEDQYYTTGDKFFGTEIPESNCSRQYNSDTEFPDDLSSVEGNVLSWVPNTTLFFSTEGLGGISGTITNTGVPIEGVTVKVVDGYASTMTDADGDYIFPYLLAGDYELALDKFGFEPDTITGITVIENDTVVADGTIDSIATYAVSGTITSSDLLAAIEGAAVTLEGYESYLDSTDASGMFMIEGVYGGTRDYVMTVSYPGYETFMDTITVVDGDLTGVDVVLEEIPYPALSVMAMINESDEAEVNWLAPGSLIPMEFRYDNGIQTGQLGLSSGGTDNTVLGSVHRYVAELHEVSWLTTAEGGPHNTVNVFILDLDETGAPTSTVLYSAMAVENTDMEWNVHTLPSPVETPNGFMIGISYAGFAGLGTTDPDDDYPFTLNTHYYATDYTNGEFGTVEGIGNPDLEKPFMIRAFGYSFGETGVSPMVFGQPDPNHNLEFIANSPVEVKAPQYSDLTVNTKEFVDYTVYRLMEGQEMGDWTEVGTNVTDTSFVDTDWASQSFGLYQYAVVANYSNGVFSEATLSNVLAKDMTVDYTVNVTTNTSDDGAGAMVTLTNQDGDPEHMYMLTADATGVMFDSVWRGVYDIVVEKAGYEVYMADSVPIEEGGLSMDVELIEIISTPSGLAVMNIDQWAGTADFGWFQGAAGFMDSFEDMTFDAWDEMIQGAGTPGDDDKAYWAVELPDGGMAPDGTYVAHVDWGYTIDTWLISPNISISAGTTLSFQWNKSYYWSVDPNDNDDLAVMISTDGGSTWTTIWTEQDYGVFDNFVWYETVLDLSAYSGSAMFAFNVAGDDNATNELDVVNISTAKRPIGTFAISDNPNLPENARTNEGYKYTFNNLSRALQGYKVYLNDLENPIATDVTDSVYQLTGLTVGTHTAGVAAVFETGTSDIATIEFVVPELTYPLIFNVMDNATSNMMEGVYVEVTDGTDDWGYYTDAGGQCTMDMVNGTYDYVVTMDGYDDVTGSVTIDGAAVTVDITMYVGISETSIPGFVVYPNPSKGAFTVKADAVGSIVVLDAIGQVVLEKEFNDATTIDMTNAAGGIYFIRLMTDDKVNTKRLIIE